MYVPLYIHVSTLILLLSIKAIAEGIEALLLKSTLFHNDPPPPNINA